MNDIFFGVLRDVFPDDAEYCRIISNSTLECYANIAETHLFTRLMDDYTLYLFSRNVNNIIKVMVHRD